MPRTLQYSNLSLRPTGEFCWEGINVPLDTLQAALLTIFSANPVSDWYKSHNLLNQSIGYLQACQVLSNMNWDYLTHPIHRETKKISYNETKRTWSRRCRNGQSPCAARILAPTVNSHQCPVVQTLWRHVDVASCQKNLSCAARRRQRQFHLATLRRSQRHDNLDMFQILHRIARASTAVRRQHEVSCWTWT